MRKLPEITDRQRQAVVITFHFEHKDPQLLRLLCPQSLLGWLSLEKLRGSESHSRNQGSGGCRAEGCASCPSRASMRTVCLCGPCKASFRQEPIFPPCVNMFFFFFTVKTIFRYFELVLSEALSMGAVFHTAGKHRYYPHFADNKNGAR